MPVYLLLININIVPISMKEHKMKENKASD